MRRLRLAAGRAASGQLAADPATALMKSRRRIALSWVRTGFNALITSGICDRGNGVSAAVFCPRMLALGH